MSDFKMSRHALSRAVDMALNAEEIRDAFDRPRHRYWSERTESWQLTRGRVTLCLKWDGAEWVVATILFARASDWAADKALPPAEGREDRDHTGVRAVRRMQKRDRGQHREERRA